MPRKRRKKTKRVELYFQEIAPEVDQMIDDLAESAAGTLGPAGRFLLKNMPGLREEVSQAITTATFIKKETPERAMLIGLAWNALTDFLDGKCTRDEADRMIKEIQENLDPNETSRFAIDNMADAILRHRNPKGFVEAYAFIAILDGEAEEVRDACLRAIEKFSITWDDLKEIAEK